MLTYESVSPINEYFGKERHPVYYKNELVPSQILPIVTKTDTISRNYCREISVAEPRNG